MAIILSCIVVKKIFIHDQSSIYIFHRVKYTACNTEYSNCSMCFQTLSVFQFQVFCPYLSFKNFGACQSSIFYTNNSHGVHVTEVADPTNRNTSQTQQRNKKKQKQKCAGWDHKKTLTHTLHEINNTALVLLSNVLYKVSLI